MAHLEALLSAARTQDRAPETLRARIEHERVAARPARRRAVYVGGLAGALAAAAIALALVLPSGTPGAPSISEAAALGFRPAVLPPPLPGTRRLEVNVDEVYFPKWEGWRAVGQRIDRLGGRPAITVYYARGTARVAYTIVGVPALPMPNTPTVRVGWLTVRTLQVSGRAVVGWRRAGDTCVLSSRQLSGHELAWLAADDVTHGAA
jgi:hypothetical protein